MVGKAERLRRHDKPAAVQQGVEIGAVMFYWDIKAEILVVALQGVETVRTGGDDLFDVIAFDQLDVFVGGHLVEVLVPQLAGRFAAAFFFLAEDAHFYPGGGANGDEVLGHRLIAFVEGGITTGEVENVNVAVLLHQRHRQTVSPVSP